MASKKVLKIGVSPSFMYADDKRPLYKGKTLLYLEQSMAHWLMEAGVMVVLIQTPSDTGLALEDIVSELDGVVMSGGSDVNPAHYGEKPLKPEWGGDDFRDRFEMELVRSCMKLDRPLLGICRGLQIINVTLGGSLFQDISHQVECARVHRDWEVYDQLCHNIKIEPGSTLSKLCRGETEGKVNSIHHQGVKSVGKGLKVEAKTINSDIPEAIRYEAKKGGPYLFAVQWHPEFQEPSDTTLIDRGPILDDFLTEVRKRASS